MTVLAITGATGFVGGHVLDQARTAGWSVRALTRRMQPPRKDVVWIGGTLDDADALDLLMEGATAVLHIAGVINAPDEAGFLAGNVTGTRAMIEAAQRRGIRRFVHVSSLAAREPAISVYGRSKAMSESLVEQSGLDWTIIRPPAVYGPGDRETLELFRMARARIMPLPPGGRLSIIEASDLARLLLAIIPATESHGRIYEPDNGTPGGLTHPDFARAIGESVQRRVWPLPMPRWFLNQVSRIDRRIRGANAKLTTDRVAYFCHPDWVCNPAMQPPPAIWQPLVSTERGLRRTAAWYREQGWL